MAVPVAAYNEFWEGAGGELTIFPHSKCGPCPSAMSDGPFFFFFCDKCNVGRSVFFGDKCNVGRSVFFFFGDKCNVGRSFFFFFLVTSAMSDGPFFFDKCNVGQSVFFFFLGEKCNVGRWSVFFFW